MASKINWSFLVPILSLIVNAISPSIKEVVTKFVIDLNKKAEATTNTVDDIFVKLLADVLNVDID